MKIAIPKERRAGETRVAATPDTVKKYVGLGLDVVVETGAGAGSDIPDADYQAAGAALAPGFDAAVADADVLLTVRGLDGDQLQGLKSGAVLAGILNPHGERERLDAYAQAGVTGFAMEFMPRITRAQSMDVLSSQSNLAGYKAVLDACAEFGRAMPMMMTAAGTIAPARVFVMGAGVAGLQAIATARRLGAIVSATAVRPVAKEQVESLGASFVAVEDEEFRQAETAGGYAKEMSDAYKEKQAALIAETVPKQDIVITTALIPGRPAPKLVSADMVKSMKPGSVIVDLAVETGGNCALSQAGKVVEKHGVTIVGHANVPSRLAADTSRLYARNLFAFLQLMIEGGRDTLAIDWEDEIIKGTCITRDGAIVHPALAEQARAAESGEAETEEAAEEGKADDADAEDAGSDDAGSVDGEAKG